MGNDRDHFYKYCTADTAKAILRSRSRKWSSPLEFNDPFDTQIDLFLQADIDTSSHAFAEKWLDQLTGKEPIPPSTPAARNLEALRRVVAERGIQFTQEMKNQLLAAANHGVQTFNSNREQYNQEVRSWFTNASIFCVSELFDNLLMWAHYAHNHTGAVIKFLSVREVDSPLILAKKVVYSRDIPRIGPEDFATFSVSPQVLVERLTLTKSIDWAYENEWRVVSLHPPGLTSFSQEEIGAVFLGCKMAEKDRHELTEITSQAYPRAEVYIARKHRHQFALEFDKIR